VISSKYSENNKARHKNLLQTIQPINKILIRLIQTSLVILLFSN